MVDFMRRVVERIGAGLMLSRRVGESIVVDGPATIHIADIRGRVVKLRIDAPPTTGILRGELKAA